MQYLPKLKQLLNHRMYLKLGVSGYQTSYEELYDFRIPESQFTILLFCCVTVSVEDKGHLMQTDVHKPLFDST